MTTNKQILDLLKREVVPALGCTEPIAAALAGAKVRETLGVIPEKVKLGVSGNILKNAMAVGIPGTGMIGLPIAVALGVVGGRTENGLEVLANITKDDIVAAKKMVEEERVCINHFPDADLLFIECCGIYKEEHVKVIIRHRHSNITYVEKNGEIIYEASDNRPGEKSSKEYPELSIQRIHDFSINAPLETIEFILEGAQMNRAIAEEGLRNNYGMQVGKKTCESIKKGFLSDDLLTHVMAITSAASDARMDGCTLPVMSNSGSGNQGLSVFLPVIAASEKLNCKEEDLVRALILSNLIAIHIKSYLGTLSALCGILIAATGASAGITYLMGGTYQQIVYAIKNMAGGITGMICDGAKVGCALKVSAGASSAVQTAILAMDDIGVSHLDGIIEKDIEKTIKNMAKIGAEGMIETDKLILKTMVCK